MGIPEDLFVEPQKLPFRLFCTICLEIADNAVYTDCEHLFCRSCLEDYKQNQIEKYQIQNQCPNVIDISIECPNCRCYIHNIYNASIANQIINNSLVYCNEDKEYCCGWIGKYALWSLHIEKDCKKANYTHQQLAKYKRLTQKCQQQQQQRQFDDNKYQYYSKNDLNLLKMEELKNILKLYGINDNNNEKLIEKSDYIDLISKIINEKSQNNFPTTKDQLLKMKIKDLINYLKSKNIDINTYFDNTIVEKSDLIYLILQIQDKEHKVLSGLDYQPHYEKVGIYSPSASVSPQPPQSSR